MNKDVEWKRSSQDAGAESHCVRKTTAISPEGFTLSALHCNFYSRTAMLIRMSGIAGGMVVAE